MVAGATLLGGTGDSSLVAVVYFGGFGGGWKGCGRGAMGDTKGELEVREREERGVCRLDTQAAVLFHAGQSDERRRDKKGWTPHGGGLDATSPLTLTAW